MKLVEGRGASVSGRGSDGGEGRAACPLEERPTSLCSLMQWMRASPKRMSLTVC